MTHFFLSLIFPLFLTQTAERHPIHVSVTEVEYDEKDKALEIMMRVFIDDLELTLRKKFANPTLDILNPGKPTLDDMMSSYLADSFSVMLDSKKQTATYLGHEREGEVFIFFVEVAKVRKWSRIEINNSIIMDVYDDQSNLVHVTAFGTVRSLRLTKGKSSGVLSF